MFGYYLSLALHSLRRNPVLSSLIVLAIGLGIGASMTMLTVIHVMSGDPLPSRSSELFYPHLDPLPLDWQSGGGPNPTINFTWPDAQNLLHARRGLRQAAMAGGNLLVRPAQADATPFFETGRFTTADFFPMFDTPFREGSGWSEADDEAHARLVVLNAKLARKLFGDGLSVGRTVNLKNTDYRVVGVLDDWRPQPQFYADINGRSFGDADQFFIPLQTAIELDYGTEGNMSCWGSSGDQRTSDQCSWLQFWVQLSDADQVDAYRRFLVGYSEQQKTAGRFQRPIDARLYKLMDWLRRGDLISSDLRLQLWLALGFLLVCVLNIVGLLLSKFMRRAGEVSVRRALGARRRDIFLQFSIESLLVGLSGGGLGLLIAQVGLWSVRQRPDDYAQLARMDLPMLLATFALAILASLLAGLLPAWRACEVTPALQLKTL
jgi:putative ABC transport system permease protein